MSNHALRNIFICGFLAITSSALADQHYNNFHINITNGNNKNLTETNYQENIKENLRTGDIILFSGHGAISNLIKLFTKSEWSHVGIALRNGTTDLYIWESTTLSDVDDVIDHIKKKGVQLVSFAERTEKYHGKIAVRHLQGVTMDDAEADALKQLIIELENRPYEEHLIDLLKSSVDTYGKEWHNEGDLSSLFCSELIATAYQHLGLLNKTEVADEYTPKDFSSAGNMILLRNATLGHEVIIKA